MDLWMDVSKDDAGAAVSVVVGCTVHPARSVFTNIPDARYWINQHHRDLHHNRSSTGIRQIGDAVMHRSAHVRWHENRGITKPECEYCND
jgi:hypothetical protein